MHEVAQGFRGLVHKRDWKWEKRRESDRRYKSGEPEHKLVCVIEKKNKDGYNLV